MSGSPRPYVFKMPDLGEGTVEAEIVRWYVAAGELIVEDQAIVEVMTDKASVEVPAPVGGRVLSTSGTPGDKIAVGSTLIIIDVADDAPITTVSIAAEEPRSAIAPNAGNAWTRVKASPANRRRAREAGIDLSTVVGSGPRGRVVQSDIAASGKSPSGGEAVIAGAPAVSALPQAPPTLTTEIKVIGLRRLIAERMSEAKRNIPHFAYIEEVDVTELESLRQHLNAKRAPGDPALTYLPLVVLALARSLSAHPECNALYDAARGVIVRHAAVHVGIATQTPDGLKVPVVRHAHALSLWELAAAIRDVSERARSNRMAREELSGSTITVTSLGKLGGIASTPVINAPEVAIIGLNQAVERPVVRAGAIVVRRIMNLSSSFDHRFVDGYDAAAMIQTLKASLEHPATIFIPKAG